MAMDKDRLLQYFRQHYLSRQEVLFKLPLNVSIDTFWPELLNRSGQSLRDYIGRIKERRDEAGQAGDLRALANRYREKKGYEG